MMCTWYACVGASTVQVTRRPKKGKEISVEPLGIVEEGHGGIRRSARLARGGERPPMCLVLAHSCIVMKVPSFIHALDLARNGM